MVMNVLFGIFLFISCAKQGPLGPMGLPGNDGAAGAPGNLGRGDLALLNMNFLNLKRSYNANSKGFDATKTDLDVKFLFSHDVFASDTVLKKENFFASLKYDVAYLKIIENAVKMMKNHISHAFDSDVLSLFSILIESAEHVRDVLSALESNFFVFSKVDDVAGIAELNVMLMTIWRVREEVIDDIKVALNIVRENLLGGLKVERIVSSLRPIFQVGKIYNQIFSDVYSLAKLKLSILEKVKELTQAVILP